MPAFDLPESSLLSEETRAALKRVRTDPFWRKVERACPRLDGADEQDVPAVRQCLAETLYAGAFYKAVRARYAVTIAPQVIGGVYTEVFTPADGIAKKSEKRVLINLHGGGFKDGSRTSSHLESIPIAALGRIRVISIDYRLAPEHAFPAASEDVAAAYRELIKTYDPRSIGFFGCSSGAELIAQSMAWFIREGLPLPGAIGMFCHGAPRFQAGARSVAQSRWRRSDSAYIAEAVLGIDRVTPLAYYAGVDSKSPLVSPGDHDVVMARFPPSLLISGSRDFTLSEVLATHAQLVRLGVPADLHVWEGMRHAFHVNPELPEAREASDVIVRFFDSHLGRAGRDEN